MSDFGAALWDTLFGEICILMKRCVMTRFRLIRVLGSW